MRSSFEPRPLLERREFVPQGAPDTEPAPTAAEEAASEERALEYARGHADARAELEAELREDLSHAARALEGCLEELRSVHEQERGLLERAIVELALAVAGQLVAAELQQDAEALAPLVADALALLPANEPITLKLSNTDAERVLAGELPELERLRTQWCADVVGDASLGRGEARVRSATASVDLRLTALLERFREALAAGPPPPEQTK